MSVQKPISPAETDDLEDRMGSIEQLDFNDERDSRQSISDDLRPLDPLDQAFSDQRVREAGMSGGETLGEGEHEDGVSMDDMSPETLLDETGARSPYETGEGGPADQELTIVSEDEIGGGNGLDEAELGRVNPLDGEPWDGEADTSDEDDADGL